MWLEDQAGRGPEEVVCLNNYIHATCEEGGLQNARSDTCGGQNKNKYVMSFWYYTLHVKKVFNSVDQFPVPGHTYLV
jgi:hypothetical protein